MSVAEIYKSKSQKFGHFLNILPFSLYLSGQIQHNNTLNKHDIKGTKYFSNGNNTKLRNFFIYLDNDKNIK